MSYQYLGVGLRLRFTANHNRAIRQALAAQGDAPPAKRQRLGAGTDRDRSLEAIDEAYRRVYDAVGCG